jgi:hypothetical protein
VVATLPGWAGPPANAHTPATESSVAMPRRRCLSVPRSSPWQGRTARTARVSPHFCPTSFLQGHCPASTQAQTSRAPCLRRLTRAARRRLWTSAARRHESIVCRALRSSSRDRAIEDDRALPSRISAQVGGRRVLTHACTMQLRVHLLRSRYSVLNAGPVRVQLCSGTWRRGHLHRVASALHQTRWRCSCSTVAAERCCEWGCPQCCQRHLEPTWPGRRRVARRCSSSGWHSPRRLSSHSTR